MVPINAALEISPHGKGSSDSKYAECRRTDPAGEAESDDEDPFADIDSEDDEELENNEILVDDC